MIDPYGQQTPPPTSEDVLQMWNQSEWRPKLEYNTPLTCNVGVCLLYVQYGYVCVCVCCRLVGVSKG